MSNSGLSDSFQLTEEKLAKYCELALGSVMYAEAFSRCKTDEREAWRASNSGLDIGGTWLQWGDRLCNELGEMSYGEKSNGPKNRDAME